MKDTGFIDDRIELVIKEFQSLISIFYIVLVAIGMLFSYQKYQQFEINIFQYSEILDFLITPFRDLVVLGVTILTFMLVFVSYKSDQFIKHKFPRYYNSKWNFGLLKSYPIASIIFLITFLLFMFSDTYGNYYRKHFAENAESISVEFINNEIKNGQLIGKNSGYVFLMENDTVKIIPIETGIKQIIIH